MGKCAHTLLQGIYNPYSGPVIEDLLMDKFRGLK